MKEVNGEIVELCKRCMSEADCERYWCSFWILMKHIMELDFRLECVVK